MKTGKDNDNSLSIIHFRKDFISQLEIETSPYVKYNYASNSFLYKFKKIFTKMVSSLLFLWVIPTLRKGNNINHPLKIYSLGEISPYLSAKRFLNEILPFWKQNSSKKKTFRYLNLLYRLTHQA